MPDALAEILFLRKMHPLVETALDGRHTVHRLAGAADPEAMLAEIGPRIRGLCVGGQVGHRRRPDGPAAEAGAHRQFRGRLRRRRRRRGASARHRRHQHAGRAHRRGRRPRDRPRARDPAAAAAGRPLPARGALAQGPLPAHRLAARAAGSASWASAGSGGRSPGGSRASASRSTITAAAGRRTCPTPITTAWSGSPGRSTS